MADTGQGTGFPEKVKRAIGKGSLVLFEGKRVIISGSNGLDRLQTRKKTEPCRGRSQ